MSDRPQVRLAIDPTADEPPFEQLRLQIAEQVRTGGLAAGAPMPTVRALAADLGLAPNTVAKAYKRLEHEGFLVTAGRRGTVVADQDAAVSDDARHRTKAFVAELDALGLSPGETMRLVRQALGDDAER